MLTILQHDETETGPRIRKTVTDKHNIQVTLTRPHIGGLMTEDGFVPDVDVYTYTRPSNGQQVWLIEAKLFFPPDVELFRGYVLDGQPTDDQIRLIVAKDLQKGSMI